MKINNALLKELRLSKSLTQDKLAEKAGIHLRTLQRIEQTGVASLRSRKAIALALDIKPTDLEIDCQTNHELADIEAPRQLSLRYFRTLQAYKVHLLLVIATLLVPRVLSYVPVPGMNLTHYFPTLSVDFPMALLNILSGGGYDRISVLTLGVIPYFLSLLTVRLFVRLRHKFRRCENADQRASRSNSVLYVTWLLAIVISSLLSVVSFAKMALLPNLNFYLAAITSLTLATVLLAWLGEKAFRRGINGIYLLLIASAASYLANIAA